MSSEEKGIKGFKASEFVAPEKVFGEEIDRKELPEGARYYMRRAAFDPAKHKAIVNLYELRDVPGELKVDKVHLEKLNFIPDEDYIALNFGPSKDGYIWIGKLKAIDGGQVDMLSETIFISEKWRRRYEEHQRKLDGQVTGAGAGQVVSAAAPAPSSFGPLDVLKVLQEGEDRAFRNMERMANIFKGTKSETPAEVLLTLHKGMNDMMLESVKTTLNMTKTVSRVAQESITTAQEAAAGEGEEAGAADGDGTGYQMPGWLKPLMPHLEAGIERLLGGGPTGAAVKALILSSAEWKEIFTDQDKWGQAVAAMEAHFGSERTEKALAMLLNKRTGKKGGK